MLRYIAALLALALLSACSTPSVHPIYTDADTPPDEPTLAGTWKADDDEPTYALTRDGDGYDLLVKDNDANDPGQWAFDARLVQIGQHRFADVAAAEEERVAQEEEWGPLFVPTHLFARYRIEGDTLRVWIIDRDWLKKALDAGTVTLAHTALGNDTILLTAETADLRAFLEKFGADPAAFPHETVLKRQP